MIQRITNNYIVNGVKNKKLKKDIKSFDEFRKGIWDLQQKDHLWPYTLVYWYFNAIDVKKGNVYSYILARSNQDLRVDGNSYQTKNNRYLTGLIDVKNKKFTQNLSKVKVNNYKIETNNFQFKFNSKNVLGVFGENRYVCNKILNETYSVNYPGTYEMYNLQASNKSVFICAQYVVAKGPLIPWNWLHFYFEDGTNVKVFQMAKLFNNKLLVGKYKLNLESIEYKRNDVIYTAKSGSKYFKLTVAKDFVAKIIYKPRLSPTWHYPQVGVHSKDIETNIDDINPNQKGYGIMEIASGLAW